MPNLNAPNISIIIINIDKKCKGGEIYLMSYYTTYETSNPDITYKKWTNTDVVTATQQQQIQNMQPETPVGGFTNIKTSNASVVAADTAKRNNIYKEVGWTPSIDGRDYTKDFKSHGVRYGWSYTDFNKKIDSFNISMLPDYDNAAEPYFAFILMSRPSLNVAGPGASAIDSNANANLTALQNHPMTGAFANDVYGQKLLLSMADNASNMWMPIITTQAKSYPVSDFELKTVEKGNTFFGHVLQYGKHNEEHRISGTVSIDFRNDRYLSILKLIYLWMSYIYLVSKTDYIEPRLSYQTNAILDYPASIYYLVTRRDMKEIVYWEKLTGVFPIKAPISIFSYSDNMILEDSLTIDFSYGIRSHPCDPMVLLDINVLAGYSVNSLSGVMNQSTYRPIAREVFPDNREIPFGKGDVYAKRPFITVEKRNGNLKYYLHWTT